MRLPTYPDRGDEIDEPAAVEMMRYAVDHGVNYVEDFEVFNNATVFQGNTVALCRNLYRSQPEPRRASACAQCGQCEERCPQQIPVAEMLARVRHQFE